MKRFTAAFLAVLIPLFLMAASTQIDWTQIKNKPSIPSSFWNDPGSGTLLKRTGAFTFAAALSADITTLLGFTPENSANKGAASGYAGLNGSSVVPTANLPACVASGASHAAGLVPDPGASAGTTKFLREDCTWVLPSASGLTDPGSNGVLKRTALNTTGIAVGSDLPGMVASGASHSAGAAPDPGVTAGTTHFLREDATWALPPTGVTAQSRPARAFTTVYNNATGKALFITVVAQCTATCPNAAYAATDASNPPTTVISEATVAATNGIVSLTFVVLNGNNYELFTTGGTFNVQQWTEWN